MRKLQKVHMLVERAMLVRFTQTSLSRTASLNSHDLNSLTLNRDREIQQLNLGLHAAQQRSHCCRSRL